MQTCSHQYFSNNVINHLDKLCVDFIVLLKWQYKNTALYFRECKWFSIFCQSIAQEIKKPEVWDSLLVATAPEIIKIFFVCRRNVASQIMKVGNKHQLSAFHTQICISPFWFSQVFRATHFRNTTTSYNSRHLRRSTVTTQLPRCGREPGVWKEKRKTTSIRDP